MISSTSLLKAASYITHIAFSPISAVYTTICKVLKIALLFIINYSLLHSSSFKFKWKLDHAKVESARSTLVAFGMTAHPSLEGVYEIKAENVHTSLKSLGAKIFEEEDSLIVKFDNSCQEVKDLLEKLQVPYETHEGESFVRVHKPRHATLIYCPGSGHIYELRKTTIAYFVLALGLDVTVFHYPGVQKQKGSVDQASLESSIQNLVQEQRKTRSDTDIILYGHCVGAGLMMKSVETYPDIKVIVDRGFENLQKLVAHSMRVKGLDIHPKVTSFISNAAFSFYDFDVKKSLSLHSSQKKIILYSSSDEFVPPDVKKQNCSFLQNQKCLDLKTNHDKNLHMGLDFTDELNRFLD